MARRKKKVEENPEEFVKAFEGVIQQLEQEIRQEPDPIKVKIDRLKDQGFDDNRIAAMLMINVEKVKKLK